MDKRLILAVAGSGKTSYIIDQLDLDNRHLIITYTINNLHNLRTKIVKKWGISPKISDYFPTTIFFILFAISRIYTKRFQRKALILSPTETGSLGI